MVRQWQELLHVITSYSIHYTKLYENYFWTLPPNTIEEIRKSIEENSNEKYDIGRTAQKLAKWTRELDTTRPVIANCILPSASLESGYADARNNFV